MSEWVSSFLAALQHNVGYLVPYHEKRDIHGKCIQNKTNELYNTKEKPSYIELYKWISLCKQIYTPLRTNTNV